MRWEVEFYDAKLLKGIEQWPRGIRVKFSRVIELVEEFGPDGVGMPHIKSLGQGLFEIRAKAIEGIGRALFCIIKGRVIIIVNEFIKKTQKTPQKEIELAKKRMKEVKGDE